MIFYLITLKIHINRFYHFIIILNYLIKYKIKFLRYHLFAKYYHMLGAVDVLDRSLIDH